MMADPKIRRKFKSLPVTLTTATQSATTIRWDDIAGGSLYVGTVSTNASTLQVWASPATDGNWGRVYASDGSAADITLAPSTATPQVYSLPDAAYGVGAIRIVAGDTHSTSAVAVVMLKT
ncbi:MAG: hypothetical protein O3A60_02725 [Planctomycetota bacterium]|jgi:hypothetical protein|nr:hypothetical protein [Planctomycetota bacterium]